MKKIIAPLILILFTSAGCRDEQNLENWTHFRGSNLNGISDSQSPPVKWNDSLNVVWKVETEGRGWSSPVVFKNQVWITSASPDGKNMDGTCFDYSTGKEIFKITIFQPSEIQAKHEINTYATPTPCIEEGFVYLHFGTYGTACLRTSDGSLVWKRTDLNCEHVQGAGSSPVIYHDLLILHIEGTDVQVITALDKRTGETVWETQRPAECYDRIPQIGRKAYITPIIINAGGRDLLISNGSAVCIAYDPLTGKEVWRIVQGEDSTIAMPFADDSTIYFYTGFVTLPSGEQYSELLAVNPSCSGDVAGTHIKWRIKSPILQLLTPVLVDGLIYTVDSENNLICIEAETGVPVYTKHLTSKYNSSPVAAGDFIYFTSTRGKTMIIEQGRKLKIEGENELEGDVFSTPAVLRNSIIFRTDTHLYRISSD